MSKQNTTSKKQGKDKRVRIKQAEAGGENVTIEGVIPHEHTPVALDWDDTPSVALAKQTEGGDGDGGKPATPKFDWPKITPIGDMSGRGPAEIYFIPPEMQLEWADVWAERFKPDEDYWEKQGINRLIRKVINPDDMAPPPAVRFTIDWLFDLCHDYVARHDGSDVYIAAVMNYRRTVLAITLAGTTAEECRKTCNRLGIALEGMLPNCGPILVTIVQPGELADQGNPYLPVAEQAGSQRKEQPKPQIKKTETEFSFRQSKRWGKEPLV